MKPRLLDLFARTYVESGCRIWTGAKNDDGYGYVQADGRPAPAHRVVYELAVGPILPGLEIDHLCRRRSCVEPSHLEAVTHAENQLRLRAAQTACRRSGHDSLDNPVQLCGSSFGLDVRRHRLFETNVPMLAPPCVHGLQKPRFAQATNRTNLRSTVEVGVWRIPLDVQQTAMGIDWMTREELSEAIPPLFTEFIGEHLMAHLASEGVAS